jgi:hypothetical protein
MPNDWTRHIAAESSESSRPNYHVMVGEGRPSTSLLIVGRKDVDGRPEPALGRAFGPTRGPTMTT